MKEEEKKGKENTVYKDNDFVKRCVRVRRLLVCVHIWIPSVCDRCRCARVAAAARS